MQYQQVVILSDLDGTLFNSHQAVSPADRAAISELVAGGGFFAVGTGREPRNARRYLPDLPINGPSVVLNGAGIYDFGSERYLSVTPMDQAAAMDVLQHCLRENWPLDLQVYTTEGIFYASPLAIADPEYLRIHQPTKWLPMAELGQKTWLKTVLLEREPEALAPMRAYLQEKGYLSRLALVDGTTDVVKVGRYQELLPVGLHKGVGTKALRSLPQYAGRTFFAVGDYWNDLEMLQAVDVPCAPANAIAEIQAVCAHVLPSNNDSPIAYLIRNVIPRL